MPAKPTPQTGIVTEWEKVKRKGGSRWRGQDGRFYEWCDLHGEWEVYNKRGVHLGAIDENGRHLKDAQKGRSIDDV